MKPAVKPGKPESEDGYGREDVDGLVFYIKDELQEKTIGIDLMGWWIFSSIIASVK